MDAALPDFVRHLLEAKKYPHPTTSFKVVQTHLSWVLLTGPYVYKIKKPVSYGFQDFTTLEQRHYYCDLEVILNQRYTHGLYERVVPICGTPEDPQLDGNGEPFEYAVKIKQFSQDDLLCEIIKEDRLTPALTVSLAQQTARFHDQTEVCTPEMAFGDPLVAHAPVLGNFNAILPLLPEDSEDAASVKAIQSQAQALFTQLESLMAARKAAGFTRACHGDMHLANAVLIGENQATFFDCIEFNESFRHTDVMSDVAFMIMDLQAHGRPDLANLFLNTYVEHTGDYEGIVLLNYYCAYRAMVRAKTAVFEWDQQTGDEKEASIHRFRQYRDLAQTYFTPKPLSLEIMFGISGSGKSTFSHQRMQSIQAIRIRSDIERKRLAGLATHQACPAEQKASLYSLKMTERTFEHLLQLARHLLTAQWPVLVDGAFLNRSQRAPFFALAQALDCSFTIWACEVSDEELSERLEARPLGVSDADLAVATRQKEVVERFSEQEQAFVQRVI
jgi:hypothetical protein